MGLKGIVVLEGANATGKTSLAKELCSRYEAVVMHQTYRFKASIFNYHTAVLRKAIKLAETKLVILDRLWMSEEVYAHVYRGGTPWPHQGRFVDRVLMKAGAVTVVCVSNDDEILRKRYKETRSHRTDADAEKNLEVNRRYLGLFNGLLLSSDIPRKTYLDDLKSWARYSTFGCDCPGDLFVFEIGWSYDYLCKIVEMAIDYRHRHQLRDALSNDNLLGSTATATHLIVGDKANPKHRWSWPFYEYGNCSLWLTEQLHRILFDESRAVWTNALDAPDVLGDCVQEKKLKVVALGRVAEKELQRKGIEIFRVLNHPQYERRFHNKGEEYRAKLLDAFQI